MPYLREAFEKSPPGTDRMLTRYPVTVANLGTQFARIIERAGVKRWPKLFQNLRSTRQTELSQNHPEWKVCRWMGNSQRVADEHYLQERDEDFKKAGQNPGQQVQLQTGNGSQAVAASKSISDVTTGKDGTLRDNAEMCETLQNALMGDGGLEPSTSRV